MQLPLLPCRPSNYGILTGRAPFEFVDWLQLSNYHFILGHAHQSIPEWNGNDLVRAYAELRDTKHPGFPSEEWLNCPILSQDKNK